MKYTLVVCSYIANTLGGLVWEGLFWFNGFICSFATLQWQLQDLVILWLDTLI